ncbi:TPA: V-ATPase V0 sector subunit c'' [Trebouxia sp. C0006]
MQRLAMHAAGVRASASLGPRQVIKQCSFQPRLHLAAARLPHRRALRIQTTIRSQYSKHEMGDSSTTDYRIFIQDKGGKNVSAWHDIPLWAEDGLLNFICEIPKESSAKMEVATDEDGTPIKQAIKKGKLRFYPYNINWNYGLLPQTWEDPNHHNSDVDAAGDNDPVDVVEIGGQAGVMGAVYKVKPLGVLAMIDDGELDWKIIAIDVNDPKASSVNDIEDVEREFPGEVDKIRTWFRDYKTPDGKPQNKFGFDDKAMNKEFTLGVIKETSGFYQNLLSGKTENTKGLALK